MNYFIIFESKNNCSNNLTKSNKEFNLCHRLKFTNPISLQPNGEDLIIFQTMNQDRSNNLILINQRNPKIKI